MIDELFIEERTKARIREVITKQWEKGRISDPGLDALAVVVRPSAWYETTDPCPLDFLPSCHYSPEKSKFNIALDKAINLVREELLRAITIHGSMKSHHDAQSVIAEENDELRLAVWYGVDAHGQPADPHDEAIQLAAMAIRYLLDIPRRKEGEMV